MEERETILDILDELAPGAEVEGCTTLVDDRVLDSLTIVALVAELEDAFDITIPAVEVWSIGTPLHSSLWSRWLPKYSRTSGLSVSAHLSLNSSQDLLA